MKTLLLMRHGKSDWGDPRLPDHDRPLATRGHQAAKRVGRFLSNNGREPDLVISSTAARAATTAEIAITSGAWKAPLVLRPDLYGGGETEVLDAIAAVADHQATIMVVGHEPTWSSLTSQLAGGGRFRFPTATVAAVELVIADWSEMPTALGVLSWFLIPRLLPAEE